MFPLYGLYIVKSGLFQAHSHSVIYLILTYCSTSYYKMQGVSLNTDFYAFRITFSELEFIERDFLFMICDRIFHPAFDQVAMFDLIRFRQTHAAHTDRRLFLIRHLFFLRSGGNTRRGSAARRSPSYPQAVQTLLHRLLPAL